MKRAIGFIVLAVIWEIAARILQSPVLIPLSKIIPSFFSMLLSGVIIDDVLISMSRIGIGYLIACIIGITGAIAISESKAAAAILMPVIDTMRPIAALTIFPLLIIILGLGIWSKVFVIFWTAWPAIILNTSHGLHEVDKSIIEAAQLDGANSKTILLHIKFPLALPTIFTGLRIGVSGGWISLVSAEMLGSNSGLGYSVLAYSQTFHFKEMYVIIIIIGLLGLLVNSILYKIQNTLDYKETYISSFVRFGDRAQSFGLDSKGDL